MHSSTIIFIILGLININFVMAKPIAKCYIIDDLNVSLNKTK